MESIVDDVSTLRLYLLRGMYLLIAAGLAFQIGPGVFAPPADLDLHRSVVRSFLAAMALMALLGLRYPLKMLPVLLYELLWKAIWVFNFWLRLWYGEQTTAAIDETFFACMMGVILVPLVVPWGYAWRHYVQAPSERWRRAT
jgi:hypothetical protein